MRKRVLVPFVIGLILVFVGVVQSYSPMTGKIIHNYGTVMPYTEETQPQQTAPTTQLDITGLLAILAGIGFFTVAFLNRKR